MPLGRRLTYVQSRTLGQLLGQIVVAERPDIATLTRNPDRREGKVYVDFVQNGHGRLLVAPYSARPVPRAAVSMPISWKQVNGRLDMFRYNLKTVRAYLLKEAFQQLWEYSSPAWAGKFLDEWCRQTMRSRIQPMKKIARSLRNHRELILNYFRAQKLLSSGVVEGLNNKAKVTMRKSYGFRTQEAYETAIYHNRGRLF